MAVGLVTYWTKKKKVRVPPNGWTSGEKKVHSFYRVKSGYRFNETQRHNIYLFFMFVCFFTFGPVRTTRNFVCFAKKSVNTKPFSVRTIFFVHENFVKRHQTSKTPSSSFGGLQFFVKRENLLFRDSYPSTGHHISYSIPYKMVLRT